jgi:hypothetical protein
LYLLGGTVSSGHAAMFIQVSSRKKQTVVGRLRKIAIT